MFRDRTNLFLSYRRTVPRSLPRNDRRFESLVEEEEGLIESRRSDRRQRYQDNNDSIEMKALPPSIFDISKEIDDNLLQIKGKTSELNSLYKKLLITNYNEKQAIENKIENLNYDITKKFEGSYVLIKKFEFLQKNHGKLNLDYSNNEISIIESFKKNYALKIQESSLIFRNLQNNYIKFLKDDEDETDTLINDSNKDQFNLIENEEESRNIENYSKQILQQTQIHSSNSQFLQTREREISKLAMGILEISTIFKEMESMVIDQGSILDRIDYNIANTAQDLKSSEKELVKAQGYQKRTTKCKLIFLLSLIVFALFIIVLVKPHGKTKVVEKPPPDTNPEDRPTINNPEDSSSGMKDENAKDNSNANIDDGLYKFI
ncbi:uncharacterized protein AC631_02648 [Debaryomyces fabryi]|uniref:t-SNARE coiled-coil homology domain-containing protein n=1 Tax=Debaryomyces fabryi TaxID=58627 RepID=A0A0V1PZU9_9ASCO|nr:uncharacterized protein AC631_02648 [Debaryomyces fabryi]KSA01573.1 hypothetical protein AC631_02648 [Debaryomyces fabryi]CUM49851.1 unnamed protein product [Debaryomyces fabryi]